MQGGGGDTLRFAEMKSDVAQNPSDAFVNNEELWRDSTATKIFLSSTRPPDALPSPKLWALGPGLTEQALRWGGRA